MKRVSAEMKSVTADMKRGDAEMKGVSSSLRVGLSSLLVVSADVSGRFVDWASVFPHSP
jgi:hypothetical protein